MKTGKLIALLATITICSSALATGGVMPGSGTLQDPYLIEDLADFDVFCADNSLWAEDVYVNLTCDLDLSSKGAYIAAPIAPDTGSETYTIDGPYYEGVFNGTGHIISNLEINGDKYCGLFGLSRGFITNLGVANARVSGTYNTGIIAGESGYNGSIIKCYSSGIVNGALYAGGLIGTSRSTVQYCYSSAAVSADNFAGGLVGHTKRLDIYKCYSTGSVTADSDAGGLAGICDSGCAIKDCFWDSETSGQIISAGGKPRTTAQMMQIDTFIGWYEGAYTINQGNDYPRLAWENKTGTALVCPYPERIYSGSGTIDNPYLLSDSSDITNMSMRTEDLGSCFELTNDIEMSAETSFYPIESFSGALNGKKHTIKGLSIRSDVIADNSNLGLIAKLTGTVRNLNISELSIEGANTNSGGIAAYNNGKIINCSVTGVISGESYLGGIAGDNDGEIINCSVVGVISGESRLGGIAGQNTIDISGCFAEIRIDGDNYLGGISGYTYGSISECDSNVLISGNSILGGIAGHCLGWAENISTTKCFSTGTINGITATGGIFGDCFFTKIQNCYSECNVTGTSKVGGLIGDFDYGSTAENCYSAGLVSGDEVTGGFFGDAIITDEYNAVNCFWNIDSSQMANGYYVYTGNVPAGLTGISTAQAADTSTFLAAGWDFNGERLNGLNDIWIMDGSPRFTRHAESAIMANFGNIDTLSLEDIQEIAVNNGYNLDDPAYVYRDNQPAGTVVDLQISMTGESVADGADIALIISKGAFAGFDGSGSVKDPYILACLGDFEQFCKDSSYWAEGVYVSLACDLDLLSKGAYSTAPVAPDTDSFFYVFNGTPYRGHFNGNDHTISNLTINGAQVSYLGLFSQIDPSGSVSNLILSNVNINGYGDCIGSLAGSNNGGLISNCSATYSITSGMYAGGGLVGKNTGTVTDCSTEGTITGNEYVGGLVGYSESEFDSDFISDCTTDSVVSGNRDTGGLIGYSETSIVDCNAKSRVTASGARCGGLVGYVTERSVNRCSAESTVNGATSTGGLIGYLDYGKAFDCYASSTVTGDGRVGGLIGYNSGSCNNSYATAEVAGNSYCGGIFGYLSGQKPHNCFWNSDLSEQGIGYLSSSSYGEFTYGITTDQFANMSIFADAGWGFNKSGGYNLRDVWMMDGRPVLSRSLEREAQAAAGNVAGLSPEAAETQITSAGYAVAGTSYLYSASVPQGCVINATAVAQSDNAGAEFEFYLNVSLGTFTGLEGEGSQENPFLIQNLGDFVEFCRTDHSYDPTQCTALTTNIDCSSLPIFAESPIGRSWYLTPYYGVIDGRGHNISNLTVSNGGLFHEIKRTSTVKNLGLENINASDGALTSSCYGTISQCYSTGKVKGDEITGGLVGKISGDAFSNSAFDCYSTCDVAGKGIAGGLFGEVRYNTVIKNCYASGRVTSDTGGGFCGSLETSYAENCFWNIDSSGLSNGYITKSDSVTAPLPVGLTATQTLDKSTFTNWDFTGSFYDGSDEIWIINEGPALTWQVSTMYTESTGNLTGLSQEEAISRIEAEGIASANVMYIYSDTPAGIVTDYNISFIGSSTADGVEAKLLVSLGEFTGLAGSGTAEEPYLIQSLGDFNEFCADSSLWAAGVYTRLTCDIDLLLNETYCCAPIAPYVNNAFAQVFRGYFDGAGHTISGLDIAGSDYCALFGKVGYGGRVSNLNVKGSVSSTGIYNGLLAGYTLAAEIYNCTAEGSVRSYGVAGGLVGYSEDTKLNRCISRSLVEGGQTIGGLAGVCTKSSATAAGSVKNCGAECTVYSGLFNSSSYCGGLIGLSKVNIKQCYAKGIVKALYNTGSTGGLIGFCMEDYQPTISNCYFVGELKGGVFMNNAGGIVGKCEQATITNCYTECNESYADNFGALVGYADSPLIIDGCFWNSELTTKDVGLGAYNIYINNAEGITAEQMRDVNTFLAAGWDFGSEITNGFDELWLMDEYPVLTWQVLGDFSSGLPDLTELAFLDALEIIENNDYDLEAVEYLYGDPGAGEYIEQYKYGISSMYAAEISSNRFLVYLLATNIQFLNDLEGAGTSDDPYLIQNLEDFNNYCADSSLWLDGVHVKFTKDIYLFFNDTYDAAPISPDTSDSEEYAGNGFKGSIDGNGHVLYGLNVNEVYYAGLIGKISGGGSVKNLAIKSARINSGGKYAGILSGYSAGGSVSGCHVDGIVSGNLQAGGLTGRCVASFDGTRNSTERCSANCIVSGNANIGGLIGNNDSDVSLSYSLGTITGTDKVGGLIGNSKTGSTISNSYSICSVRGEISTGGITGVADQAVITNVYSACEVSGSTIPCAFAGRNYNSVISSSFWNADLCENPGQGVLSGVIGLTAPLMQDEAEFINAGWDFASPVWVISSGDYPRLALHLPDYNLDGFIDVEDLLNLSENWLAEDNPISPADFSGDGDVNNNDLRFFAESWLRGS